MSEVVYMAIEKDEYELPYAVAESGMELARILSVSQSTIHTKIMRSRRGECKRSKYIRVEVNDE